MVRKTLAVKSTEENDDFVREYAQKKGIGISQALNEIIKAQRNQTVLKVEMDESKTKSHKEKEQDILDSGSWIKELKPDKQGYQYRYVGTYQCDRKRKGQAWCDRLHSFEEAYYFAELKNKMDAKREERKLEALVEKKEEKIIKGWATQKLSTEIVDQLGICINPLLIRSTQSSACGLCKKKYPEKRQACDEIVHELEMSPIAKNNFIRAMTEKKEDWFKLKPEDFLIDEGEEFLAFQKRYHEICVTCEHLPDACSRYCQEFYSGLPAEFIKEDVKRPHG